MPCPNPPDRRIKACGKPAGILSTDEASTRRENPFALLGKLRSGKS